MKYSFFRLNHFITNCCFPVGCPW